MTYELPSAMETKVKNGLRGIILLTIFVALGTSLLSRTGSSSNGSGGLLLVANKGDKTLSIVDPDAGKQLAAVAVGGTTGHEVAASSDGRTAWVPIYGNSGVGQPGTDGRIISVIDLGSQKRVAEIDLGAPNRPHCAVFGPKDGRLYVTAELSQSVKIIDPASRTVVDSIPTGAAESHMLALSSDGKRAYTSNVGDGTVSAIDVNAKKVVAVIPVAKTAQRIAISVDNRWVFTSDQTKPELVVIDTQGNSVKTRVPLSARGFGVTPTHDGRYLLITHPSTDSVSILNLQTLKVDRVVRVPADPQEILVRPDDRLAYVSCDVSKKVAAIDLASGKVEQVIDVGSGADGLAWAPQAAR